MNTRKQQETNTAMNEKRQQGIYCSVDPCIATRHEVATELQKWTKMSAHKLVRVKGRRRPLLPVIEYCITGGRGTHFPTVMTFRSGAVVVYRVCADPLADSATNLTPLVTTIMMMMIMIRTHICTCDKWSTLSR